MIPLFDLHCDTLSAAFEGGYSLQFSPLHISFDKCSIFSPYAQIMAIWTNNKLSDNDGFERYKKIIEYAKSQGIEFITSADKISNFSLYLAIEDLRIIENDIYRLDLLYNDGVRFITPVWRDVNVIGGAWNTDAGLSSFGKQAIARMLELGIIPDVSHASTKTFYDILDICAVWGIPPIATHSNSYSVCQHKRNLTNTQFLNLVQLGSCVGISLAPEHLSNSGFACIDDILKHIDAYLSLGGENSICLGCDFDGVSSLPAEITDISSLEKLYSRLLKAYGIKITEKIFSLNFVTLLKSF